MIIAKVNSLLDPNIIQALYRASQAGVQIELIVRGACALRPGVRGISSRIRVRSVVGRFLEHSRIFVFRNGDGNNGGESEVYLGSADWMPRNLYERVEVMFRLKDAALCRKIYGAILAPYLADTAKSRILQPDGSYSRAFALDRRARTGNGTRFSVQNHFINHAEGGSDFPVDFVRAHHPDRQSASALEFLIAQSAEPPDPAQELGSQESNR
jgi:polyphosphate kinase